MSTYSRCQLFFIGFSIHGKGDKLKKLLGSTQLTDMCQIECLEAEDQEFQEMKSYVLNNAVRRQVGPLSDVGIAGDIFPKVLVHLKKRNTQIVRGCDSPSILTFSRH
jgi:hypothetical protein